MKRNIFICLRILILTGCLTASTSVAAEIPAERILLSEELPVPPMPKSCVTSVSILLGMNRLDSDEDFKAAWKIKELIDRGEKALEEGRQVETAIISFKEALQIAQTANVRSVWQGQAFLKLGNAAFALKDFPKALEYYQSALPLLTNLGRYDGDRLPEILSLRSIGKTYHALGRSRQAINTYLRASDRTRNGGFFAGNCIQEAIVRNNIGEIYAEAGNLDLALTYLQQALELRTRLSPHPIDLDPVVIFNNNGKIHFELGDEEQALAFFDQSFQAAEQLNRDANFVLKRIKSELTSKKLDSSSAYGLKSVRSEFRLGIQQLEATIAILKQLSKKLEKNPDLQSRYMAKMRDCQKLKDTMTIALNDLDKFAPVEIQ